MAGWERQKQATISKLPIPSLGAWNTHLHIAVGFIPVKKSLKSKQKNIVSVKCVYFIIILPTGRPYHKVSKASKNNFILESFFSRARLRLVHQI